jgi:cell division transport system permease protein
MARRLKVLAEGADRPSARLLPWVIAVMVYLSALSAAGVMALRGSVALWSDDMERQLTVQIVTGDAASRDRQTAAAATYLRSVPGVAAVHKLDQEEVDALLEPWLGVGNVSADLPVPALIDVTLAKGSQVNTAAVATKLKSVAPDAVLDDHGQWLGRVRDLSTMIEGTAYAVLTLVALATIAIVTFGTHAGLSAHRDTIETLHIIGAQDKMVAREFQDRFMWLGFKGGVIGIAVAAISILAARRIIGEVGLGILGPMAIDRTELVLLAGLPFAAALLTMLTARITVMRALARMV